MVMMANDRPVREVPVEMPIKDQVRILEREAQPKQGSR